MEATKRNNGRIQHANCIGSIKWITRNALRQHFLEELQTFSRLLWDSVEKLTSRLQIHIEGLIEVPVKVEKQLPLLVFSSCSGALLTHWRSFWDM